MASLGRATRQPDATQLVDLPLSCPNVHQLACGVKTREHALGLRRTPGEEVPSTSSIATSTSKGLISVLLHSSDNVNATNIDVAGDPNSYRPFKLVDSVITRSIERELEGYDMEDNECARLHRDTHRSSA